MNQIFTVFIYTLKDAIRKKAFIISTVIMLLIVAVLCALPRFIGSDTADDTTVEEEVSADNYATCYYIDEKQEIEGGLLALKAAFPGVTFIEGKEADIDQYRSQIEDDSNITMVVIEQGE